MPLSSEPLTFGQQRALIDWEKEAQLNLKKRLRRIEFESHPSYVAELNKLIRTVLMPRYKKEVSMSRPFVRRVTKRNHDFRIWMKRQPEYKALRKEAEDKLAQAHGYKMED